MEPGAPTRQSDHDATHEQANHDQNYKAVVQGRACHPDEKSRPTSGLTALLSVRRQLQTPATRSFRTESRGLGERTADMDYHRSLAHEALNAVLSDDHNGQVGEAALRGRYEGSLPVWPRLREPKGSSA